MNGNPKQKEREMTRRIFSVLVILGMLVGTSHEFEKGYRKGGIKGGLASWLTSWFSPIGFPTKIFLTEEQQEKFRGGLIRMFTNIQNMLPWLGVVPTGDAKTTRGENDRTKRRRKSISEWPSVILLPE